MNPIKARMAQILTFVKRNGFYLSLGACLVLVGGALYFARARVMTPAVPMPTPAPAQVAGSLDERFESVKPPAALAWPVSGHDVLTPHSPAEPTWSDTLELWQTHAGVDIAAVKGEVVYAAIDGMVTRAARDSLLGYVVEVTGADGVVTRYANLATAQMAKMGDHVKAGDVVGAVGDSSALESGQRAHLHFEAYQNGEWLALT